MLHSGVIYPSERDPQHLFRALRQLVDQGRIGPERFRLRLRATAHDDLLRPQLRACGLEAMVELLPSIAYRDALQEMMRADGLLVMQASSCNEQIPAKIYEYLRAGRPIIGLTSPEGSTARTLRAANLDMIAPLDSTEEIARVLGGFVEAAERGSLRRPEPAYVARCSRRARTEMFADILHEAVAGGPVTAGQRGFQPPY